MGAFAAWCAPYMAKKCTFIARPSCFDWPWIVWYAWTYLGENPFGFRAFCASSWFEARGRRFSVELAHVAVEDARSSSTSSVTTRRTILKLHPASSQSL